MTDTPKFTKLIAPKEGNTIKMTASGLEIPDNPIVPYIEGDGTGPDIWKASQNVLDAAVKKAYNGKKKIVWFEVLAGEKAFKTQGDWLPEDTLTAFRHYLVSIKGPLTTPIGKGMRSLNVAIRQMLDLYVCLRPVKYFTGVPSPVKNPQDVDMTIFRENTEDIYAGIEFERGTEEVKKVLQFLQSTFPKSYEKIRFPDSCGIGIKPVSQEGTARIVRSAIEFALKNKQPSVTLVHKGNIMKFTEGGFRNWGYEVAEKEYADKTYTWNTWERTKKEKGEEVANKEMASATQAGKIIVKDVIADIALQQVLTRPKEFSVIATLNLNGDYLSDALAAQIGGIGIAPGGNINYQTGHAVFEATHGTAPKYAGLDKVNPGSVILSGEMLLRYIGWDEAADLVVKGMLGSIESGVVTYDFARLMQIEGRKVTEVACSAFGESVVKHMN